MTSIFLLWDISIPFLLSLGYCCGRRWTGGDALPYVIPQSDSPRSRNNLIPDMNALYGMSSRRLRLLQRKNNIPLLGLHVRLVQGGLRWGGHQLLNA